MSDWRKMRHRWLRWRPRAATQSHPGMQRGLQDVSAAGNMLCRNALPVNSMPHRRCGAPPDADAAAQTLFCQQLSPQACQISPRITVVTNEPCTISGLFPFVFLHASEGSCQPLFSEASYDRRGIS